MDAVDSGLTSSGPVQHAHELSGSAHTDAHRDALCCSLVYMPQCISCASLLAHMYVDIIMVLSLHLSKRAGFSAPYADPHVTQLLTFCCDSRPPRHPSGVYFYLRG